MSCVQFFISYCTSVVLISSAIRCFTVLHVRCAVLNVVIWTTCVWSSCHKYYTYCFSVFCQSCQLFECLVFTVQFSMLSCAVSRLLHSWCWSFFVNSLCCLFVGILQLLLWN